MTLIPANHKKNVHLNKSNDKDFYLNSQNLRRYCHSAVPLYAEKIQVQIMVYERTIYCPLCK